MKNLLFSGRNAILVIKSNSGKAEVILNVDLCQASPSPPQCLHHRSCDGASRQRCQVRRAQARTAKSEEAQEPQHTEEEIDDQVKTAAQAIDSGTNLNLNQIKPI
jgi:hypothetical protein